VVVGEVGHVARHAPGDLLDAGLTEAASACVQWV
jgi:hypothetical protein